jgi:hypothetical protein
MVISRGDAQISFDAVEKPLGKIACSVKTGAKADGIFAVTSCNYPGDEQTHSGLPVLALSSFSASCLRS